jgi:plastocyanin
VIACDQRVIFEVAAAVPSGGRSKEEGTAARDGGGYLALACAILLFPLSSSAQADITGTVTLQGKPNSQDETFVAKANGCGESPIRHTENWKVGPKGELGDVVVWIVDPKFQEVIGAKVPPEIELKQIGCRYVPHVAAVQAADNFKVINGDPTLHNVRAKVYDGPGKPPGADIFNFGQATQGQTDEKEFDDPGIYTLQCDVHAWMQCWVKVIPGPNACFGVTDLDGKFSLRWSAVLVDGDYKVDAWHPRFAQTLEQTIHVKNGVALVNFQFDGTKSF